MNENYQLYHGDCLETMQQLIEDDVKVDLILTDPPYGTTQCKWDSTIPLDDMWECIKEIRKDTTSILLFGAEPFSSTLRMSNIKEYKYDWIWNKKKGTNFLNANRTPLPCHEIISVFYKKLPCYNPQKRFVGVKYTKPITPSLTSNVYCKFKDNVPYYDDGYRFPLSVIECNKSKTEAVNSKNVHPTQKPVKLLEYFIKTYTNPDDVVLDFTMGSGSTGVACMNLNRKFIGIELEDKYYNIAEQRLMEATRSKQTTLI